MDFCFYLISTVEFQTIPKYLLFIETCTVPKMCCIRCISFKKKQSDSDNAQSYTTVNTWSSSKRQSIIHVLFLTRGRKWNCMKYEFIFVVLLKDGAASSYQYTDSVQSWCDSVENILFVASHWGHVVLFSHTASVFYCCFLLGCRSVPNYIVCSIRACGGLALVFPQLNLHLSSLC